jgi:hypothetical protein
MLDLWNRPGFSAPRPKLHMEKFGPRYNLVVMCS